MGSRPTYEELEKRILELENSEIKSKQASKDIKCSTLFLHTLIDINPFPMWAADREGTVIYANRSLCETIQLTEDVFIGQYNILNDENLENQGVLPLVRAVFENHESVRFSVPWKARLAGEDDFGIARDMVLDVSMFPLLNDHGELLNVVCQWFDITDQKRAEDALRKSEARFWRLSGNLSDMIYRMSLPDGIYEYVSPASVNIFGYRPQEFYNNPLLIRKVIHHDWHDSFGKEWNNLLKGKVSPIYEYQIIHKDKGIRWVNQRNTLEKDERGIPIAIVGAVTDITEQKEAEAELVNSRTQLRILVDTIPDLVWLKDSDGVYLSCNPVFERFFGAKEALIVGKTDYDFLDKDLVDFFRGYDRKVMESDKPSINEEWLTFSDNGYCGLFETIKTPMKGPEGKLIGVLGIARDITKRKKAEEALIQNEIRYKSAQRMGLVGNWEYDLVSEIFWGSDQAKIIYGFKPDSDHFTTEEVEKCIPERQRVHQALVDLIEKNKPYDLEFVINPVSGPKTKTIKSNAELIKDDQNNPLRIVGVIQDITSQKESVKEKLILEQKLLQAQKMESIGNLAGGIAHDFNNILTSVLGFAELALDETEKGSLMEENLEEIYAGGLRAKEIVSQILAFSRQSDVEKKPIQVDTIILEALKLIRPSTPTTIEIRKEIESSSWVMGNATQIHQIIMNLCTNAAHAMQDNGGVMVVTLKDVHFKERINTPEGLEKGRYIELSISDTGCGIEPGHIDLIFDPYFTTKETGKGTGMGLAMVRGIVDSYNGMLLVESSSSAKTIFTIYLPITSNLGNGISIKTEILPRSDEHILFVDDEPPIVSIGSRILESLGYRVTSRTSSVEALELFKAKPDGFQLVITDMTMPHMTGDQFAYELRQVRADVPIIICTGYSDTINAETAQEIGINAFMYKPFSRADLARTVKEALDKA